MRQLDTHRYIIEFTHYICRHVSHQLAYADSKNHQQKMSIIYTLKHLHTTYIITLRCTVVQYMHPYSSVGPSGMTGIYGMLASIPNWMVGVCVYNTHALFTATPSHSPFTSPFTHTHTLSDQHTVMRMNMLNISGYLVALPCALLWLCV